MNNSTQMYNRILQIPIEDIIPNRFQPRLAFDAKSLEELANSIKQHGIIQPLVLRRTGDKYEIIAGERRYKAATMAGLASVPAIISDLDDNASAEVAIVENVQRKDLTAIEEAKSYQALLDKGYMTQEELAKKMGLSQSAISNKLRLLTLDAYVQDAVIQEKISERHARSLLKLKNPEDQKKMLDKIINERLTVRQLEEEIKKMNGVTAEVPIVNTPDINNIVNNAEDLFPSNKKVVEESVENPVSVDVNNMFSSAEKMPNKFFNFLEDEAANMSMQEQPTIFEVSSPKVEEPVEEETDEGTDGIEMLDGPVNPIASLSIVNETVNTIRNLHLNSEKIRVEEINLPHEYHINIIIKKD